MVVPPNVFRFLKEWLFFMVTSPQSVPQELNLTTLQQNASLVSKDTLILNLGKCVKSALDSLIQTITRQRVNSMTQFRHLEDIDLRSFKIDQISCVQNKTLFLFVETPQ